jgi:hypothetical protein
MDAMLKFQMDTRRFLKSALTKAENDLEKITKALESAVKIGASDIGLRNLQDQKKREVKTLERTLASIGQKK